MKINSCQRYAQYQHQGGTFQYTPIYQKDNVNCLRLSHNTKDVLIYFFQSSQRMQQSSNRLVYLPMNLEHTPFERGWQNLCQLGQLGYILYKFLPKQRKENSASHSRKTRSYCWRCSRAQYTILLMSRETFLSRGSLRRVSMNQYLGECVNFPCHKLYTS